MSILEYQKDPGWKYLRQSDDERLANASKPYDSKTDCWVSLSSLLPFSLITRPFRSRTPRRASRPARSPAPRAMK